MCTTDATSQRKWRQCYNCTPEMTSPLQKTGNDVTPEMMLPLQVYTGNDVTLEMTSHLKWRHRYNCTPEMMSPIKVFTGKLRHHYKCTPEITSPLQVYTGNDVTVTTVLYTDNDVTVTTVHRKWRHRYNCTPEMTSHFPPPAWQIPARWSPPPLPGSAGHGRYAAGRHTHCRPTRRSVFTYAPSKTAVKCERCAQTWRCKSWKVHWTDDAKQLKGGHPPDDVKQLKGVHQPGDAKRKR